MTTAAPRASRLELRPGSDHDVDIVVRLLDDAVAWLVAEGRSGQWGSEPWSAQPRRVERIGGMLRDNELTVAWLDGQPVGVVVVGANHPPYVADPPVAERYIHLLVTSPTVRRGGIGARLLDHARQATRQAGVRLLRVDSYAGGDRKLVAYYVGQGFTPVATFDRDGWPGQVYEQWLDGVVTTSG